MFPQPYNPDWLAALATDQHPDQPWLADAFSRCTSVVKRTKYIIHFVDPTHANRPGAEWQFDRNLCLKDPAEGNLVIDILKNERIGAVEFYDLLLGHAR